MARKTDAHSVLFYKRMIAATLAFIILALSVSSIELGIRLRHRSVALRDTENRLLDYEIEEMRRQALEEAERQKNIIPPERAKPEGERSAAEILAETRTIVHALGDVDGIAGLNCLEGFRAHYEAGARVFEADFRMTSDGYVVLRHDWRADWQEGISERSIPTLEEYLATPIFGEYTPLSFHDLLLLMVQYPDICIVTDSKFVDAEIVTKEFEAMVADARKMGLTYLFDRMVVQVYSQLMFSVVDSIHHFPHYIYTLYMDGFLGNDEDFMARAEFCRENGIYGITIWDYQWQESFSELAKDYGLRAFVHTVNDAGYARSLLEIGVDAVYTDSLDPLDLADAEEHDMEVD